MVENSFNKSEQHTQMMSKKFSHYGHRCTMHNVNTILYNIHYIFIAPYNYAVYMLHLIILHYVIYIALYFILYILWYATLCYNLYNI